MEKKIKHIIIVVVAVIAIVGIGIGAYTWYNAQFDENLVKASGYQTLSLKTINDDINKEIQESSLDAETIKSKMPGFWNALNESISANNNITFYLTNAKKFTKNDVEKQYVELLLEKNKANQKINEYMKKRLTLFEKYGNGEISLLELSDKNSALNKEYATTKRDEINNKIMKLLTENPDFKQRLVGLGVDDTYLGKSPS